MATLQTNPSLVPDAVAEWTSELNISEIGRVGKLVIDFTLWDETSTSVPYIKEGSIVELNNSLYVEGSDVALDVTGQTASSINYVIYKVSGSTATAYLEPTAPTASDYDVVKGGFYDSSGNRWTGHYMYVSTAGTAYSNKGFLEYANGSMLKYRIDDEAGDFVIDGELNVIDGLIDGTTVNGDVNVTNDMNVTNDINVANDVNVTNDTNLTGSLYQTITSSGVWSSSDTETMIVPKGIYNVGLIGTGYISVAVQIHVSGGWRTMFQVGAAYAGGTIISDGTNTRIQYTSSWNQWAYVYYQKF